MLISIITPAHRKEYLDKLYQSLVQQIEPPPWEWVLLLNGDLHKEDLFPQILTDSRVKIFYVHPDEQNIKNIGFLKNQACRHTSPNSDLYVEVDSDDLLPSFTLQKLSNAILDDSGGIPESGLCSFYYSDFINLKPDNTCELYGVRHGWQHYKAKIDGKEYSVNKAFPPSARSLCQIFFAPNHIRAWSKAAYNLVGGHDPTLEICDDQDLICRTYLAGVEFRHIQEPLYIYRLHPTNTFVLKNQSIQTKQAEMTRKYLHPLILEECRRKSWHIVDLQFDSAESNLSTLPDNSVGFITAKNYLTRLNSKEVPYFMNEVYRVLVPGGWFHASTPCSEHPDGRYAKTNICDPDCRSLWSKQNFKYYTDSEFARLIREYRGRFQQVLVDVNYPTEFHETNKRPYIHSYLLALKDQRNIGATNI